MAKDVSTRNTSTPGPRKSVVTPRRVARVAAGGVAVAIGAQPAHATGLSSKLVVLTASQVDGVLHRSHAARTAAKSFGPIKVAYRFPFASSSSAGLVHEGVGGKATLSIIPDDPAYDDGAVCLDFTPESKFFDYRLPDNTALAIQEFESGIIRASGPTGAKENEVVHPDSVSGRVSCFVSRIGARSQSCKSKCSACGWDIVKYDPLDFLTTLLTDDKCWACIACAGGSAIAAARECFF